MSRLSRIKDKLGRAMGNQKDPANAPANLAQAATIEGETTIISDTTGTFAEMTPEQITARNRAILAQVSHNPPADERIMEGFKKIWRIVGPIAFIVFTAGEVYYYIKHFLPQDNSIWTQVLLWGITLLIEIPFAIATYDLSGRKRRSVEAKRAGRPVPDKDTPGAIVMWCAMASINLAGQIAFLVFITKVGSPSRDWPIYLFIAFRVIGVILGDAYVAFFLSPAPLEVDHIVRHQKAQGEGFDQLNDAAMDRKLKESRAQMQLEQNQRTIERERNDATFMAQFHEMNAQAILQQQARLLELKAPDEKRGDI